MADIEPLRQLYASLLQRYGGKVMSTWGTFALHEAFYWGSFVPFLVASRIAFFDRWKIQAAKVAGDADVAHCARRVAVQHVFLVLPLILVTHPLFALLGADFAVESLPAWRTILLQLAFYFVVEDFAFYWIHRLLHTPWLYKNVHVVHHRHSAPFGIAAEYAHPFEVVFLGLATFAGPLLVPPHLITLYAWIVARMLQTVECHSGYDFPWSLNRWCPLYGGAEFHDHHHRIHSGNYASTFIWTDALFNTDVAYRIWRRRRADKLRVQ